MAEQPGTWVFQDGPVTYTCSAAVTKGQLVMHDSANPGQVKPATAGSTNVLGVAMKSAAPSTDPTSHTALNRAGVGPQTSVAIEGVVRVTFASAAAPGDQLVAAANGAVAKYTAGTTTYDQVVGKAMSVVASGAVGWMDLP